jgi:hypothetical protein
MSQILKLITGLLILPGMKKTTSTLLTIFGVLFSIIAVISAFWALTSLAERYSHGAGLMFADVEIFIVLTLIFLTAGIICFWIAAKIRKNSSTKS